MTERICLGKIRGIEGRILRSGRAGRLMKDMGKRGPGTGGGRGWIMEEEGRGKASGEERTPMKPGAYSDL